VNEVSRADGLSQRGILMVMHSLSQGGADRVAVLLANGFARARIPTRIALMRDLAESQPEIRAMLDPEVGVASAGPPMGLRISRSGPPVGHRHLERARGVRFLRRQIDEHSPAVVLAPTDDMGLITALARREGPGEPLFAMKLTNALLRPGSSALKAFYRRKLFEFILNRLDLVLALSEPEERELTNLYPGRAPIFRTVPNPYISDAMLAKRPTARERHSPRLVTAGRMVQQKRFDVLLRAFARISRADAKLTILGDGPLRPSLEALAQSLAVAGRVDMPGYTGDVLSHLRQSDLFVLSSDYEGLPAVVLEALASGVPVVSTDSFLAALELLGSAPGCSVVPIGDPERLAVAIDQSLGSKPGSEDLRKIALPYRIDTAVSAHIEAFERLCAERQAAAA
jgi:glycosyltransferase involved in cell wall biosynthesis